MNTLQSHYEYSIMNTTSNKLILIFNSRKDRKCQKIIQGKRLLASF